MTHYRGWLDDGVVGVGSDVIEYVRECGVRREFLITI